MSVWWAERAYTRIYRNLECRQIFRLYHYVGTISAHRCELKPWQNCKSGQLHERIRWKLRSGPHSALPSHFSSKHQPPNTPLHMALLRVSLPCWQRRDCDLFVLVYRSENIQRMLERRPPPQFSPLPNTSGSNIVPVYLLRNCGYLLARYEPK